jgi:UDP-3-O-[3-hydroxymyristoyl] glucosamine N-acyltransferase
MADPRFYDNRGPFTLTELCARLGLPLSGDGKALVCDVASLEDAGPSQLSYCTGKSNAKLLARSDAGVCLLDDNLKVDPPAGMIVLRCPSAAHGFAAAATLFYPEHGAVVWNGSEAIDKTALIGEGARLAPGAVVGPGAEIGEGTQIGANTVIGRGVAIGRDCRLGSNVSITHAYVGDEVTILPGAQIGQPGFGFASSPKGHTKIPQLGRVIVQDRVEIGACTTIDRGALGDTVVGEGTKIDNLVQIGHNCRIGRHAVIVAQVGISGSSELGEFVVLGGQAGVADHARIGDGARLAGRTGVLRGDLPGGQDYGGVPARPVGQWLREVATLAALAKRPKRDGNG